MRTLAIVMFSLMATAAGCAPFSGGRSPTDLGPGGVDQTLDRLARASAAGDADAVQACFTKDARVVNAVTGEPADRTEVATLWSVAYARAADRPAPRPAYRVTLSPSGRLAWFEEESASESPPRCVRGLAVKPEGPRTGWLVAHCELRGSDAWTPSLADTSSEARDREEEERTPLVSSPKP